jgi:outer membrane protein OmpA-like peptidoglycan-associated protein
MKKMKFTVFGMALLTIVSCSTKAGNGALIGTGAGAALGAVIGKIAGNTVVGTAVGGAVGATAGTLIGRHMDKVKAEAEAQLANAKVEETKDANGLSAVKVTFDNGILFKVGKYDLQPSARTELANFSHVLKNNPDCSVSVQGYASSDGSDALNLTLSQNRASSVTSYLTNTCGVAPSQITSTKGYGETNLVLNSDGTENREASRRVEVYLYASAKMIEAAQAGTLQ